MKLRLPLLFFLFFLSINISAQQRLIKINQKIDNLENQYDLENLAFFSLQSGNIQDVDKILGTILEQLKQFNKGKNSSKYMYSIRYVRARIMKYYLQSQRILSYNQLSWSKRKEDFNIHGFQKFIDNRREGPRSCYFLPNEKTHIKNRFRDEEKTIKKLITSDFNVSFDSLWKNNIELGYEITKADSIVYTSTTKDSTLREFEHVFLHFLQNSFKYEAFEAFYKIYVSDGEKTTLDGFASYTRKKYPNHFLQLSKTYNYKRDRRLSNFTHDVFRKDENDITISELEEIIDSLYPKEPSFTALQLLIKSDIRNKDYCKALEILDKYDFTFKQDINAFNKVSKKFVELKELLKKKSGEEQAIIISFLNNPKNEVRIMTNDIRDRFFIRGSGNGISTLYQKEKQEWNKIKSLQGGHSIFLFDNNQKLRKKVKRDFLKLRNIDFVKEQILDINFSSYDNYDILFFITKSAEDRKDTDFLSTDRSIDYKSYGHVDKNSINNNGADVVSLRDIEKKESFHGMKHGNINTDIYYVYKRKTDNNWSRPYNIGNTINTPFSERTPVLSGSTLYFSSEGHAGFGGLDIFETTVNINFVRPDGEVEGEIYDITGPITISGEVENLFRFNSTFDDLSFTPVGTINEHFFSSNRTNNSYNIYYHNGKVDKSRTGTIFNLKSQRKTGSTSNIAGTIKNPCGINEVRVYLNGSVLDSDDYKYNNGTGVITTEDIKLEDGENRIKVEATDNLGYTTNETFTIDTKVGAKPEVFFIAPDENSYFFDDDTITVKAIVRNVHSKDSIIFKINDVELKNGHFKNNLFYCTKDENTKLKIGLVNKFELIGKNEFGIDKAQMELASRLRISQEFPNKRAEDIFNLIRIDTTKGKKIGYDKNKFILTGSVTSARDGSPLDVDMLFIAKDGEYIPARSDTSGRYTVALSPKEYNLSITGKDGKDILTGSHYYDFRAMKGRPKLVLDDGKIEAVQQDIIVASSDTSNLLSEIFFFDTNKWDILNPNKLKDKFIDYHKEWSQVDYIITVYGYADYRGEEAKNCILSRNRASSIKKYLVDIGFDSNRIKILGVGEVSIFDSKQVPYSLPYPRSYYLTQEDYDLQMNRRGQLMISFPNNQPSPTFLRKKKVELPKKDCLQTIRP